MYLRAAKADAEEAGIETDGMANSVSELRETIKTLTHDKVDIMSDEAGTQFKSTTQIMREIAEVYDSLSDVDQAALLKTISGKRMANTTSALIQNWSTVEDVIESTKNATGSADAENAKHLDSIEGKMQQFQAQFQSASTSVLDSGLVKGTIDAGSGILGFFNTLIDKLGILPGLIAPVTSLLLSMNGKSIIGGKGESGENTLDGSGLFSWLKNYNTKNHDYWQDQKDILTSYAQMKQKLRGADFEKALSGATIQSREFAKSLDTVGDGWEVVSSKIDNFVAKQEKVGTLGAKITSTFKGIGSAIASMAVSMAAVMAIQIAITGIATVIDKAIMSAKEASEVTGTVLSNYSKATSEIDNNLSSVDNMRERFKELSKGVTDSGKNVSLSTEQYQEYQDMVSQLVSINPALIQGYNDEQQAIINKNEAIQQTLDLLKQQRIQEANETVRGGSSTNDGHKRNYEAAYIDMEGQIDQANQELDNAKGGIASFLQKAYKEASETGTNEASRFKKILESAAGQTFDEYADYWKAKGSKKVEMDGFILGNSDKFGDNIQDIINQLNDANLLSKDLASEGVNVERTWSAAMDTYDNASGSLKQIMQAALEANAQYYDLSQSQQAFLSDYVSGIDTSMLEGKGEEAALNYANAMMKVVTETDAGKNAIDSYYKLLDKRDSMPFDQFEGQATQLFDIIRAQLSNYLTDDEMASVDLSKIFGLTQFEEDMKQMRDAIRSNFKEALSGSDIEGSSVDELIKDFNLEKLSKDQLSALNSALIDTGDHASEFAARLAALAQVGALPEALDAISNSLSKQTDSLNTVSDALSNYETSMEGITDHVQDHESMVSIYDDFAESVNKGQINTEEARNQMELLIGKVVSLKEAKQWIKDNEGLFLTGTDEDNVGQDLTGTLNTLHKKYNELSADKKKAVDGLMDVDWNTGSMQVAQHDVVALADAFGISAASLQQSLDLISTYSDYVPKTVSSVTSSIQTLNNDTYRIKQSVSEADRSSTKAWEHMSESAKIALESLTEGTDIDVKEISVDELDTLVSAMNKFKASIGGETPTFDGLKASLESVKTASGEAAASVERLDNGGWSINVSNLDAFASSLGVTKEQAQIVLSTMAQIQDEAGNPVQLTIEGNTVEAAAKVNAVDEALKPIEKERHVNVNTSEANSKILYTVGLMSGIHDKSVTIRVNTVQTTRTEAQTKADIHSRREGNKKQDFAGHVGKMTQYASGGNAVGGKTLVGELGPEQWISRDGKRSKFVGLHGMEVIDTKPGDAIVPANLTAGLMHGGIPHQAYNTWGGVSASNPLSNLNYGTGGKFRNWTSSSSSKKSNATVKVSADTSQLSDSAKEALDKIKEEVEDIIDQIEHKIYLVEKQRGDPMQIVAYYKQIQAEAKKAADRFRAQGQKDSSEYVRNMQKQWKQLPPAFIKSVECVFYNAKIY